jgi:hypothetical protein
MPPLGRHAAIVSAFHELSTERQIGMSVGPIPMSKVTEYLREHRLPAWWARVISAADCMELERHAKEASNGAKAKSA